MEINLFIGFIMGLMAGLVLISLIVVNSRDKEN